MNFSLVARLLGIVALLIGGAMLFSLPWAHPALGRRGGLPPPAEFELRGFFSLLGGMTICLAVAALLLYAGRGSQGRLFRKEAMAVVGLSWVLATVLGALPYLLCTTYRASSVRLLEDARHPLVYDFDGIGWQHWKRKAPLSDPQRRIISVLLARGARGASEEALREETGIENIRSPLIQLTRSDADWNAVLHIPRRAATLENPPAADPQQLYRIRWVPMGVVDALFESQSGFSTTGATVLADLEDPALVPHCILFWRSSTHFLGGLGIIVLFVSLLGQGSAGKALMRAEIPGPSKEGSAARMQHSAWIFAAIYCGLTLLLTLLLVIEGMTLFDALCHAFGAMATGGFSTYNASLGHFNSSAVDYTVILFMALAGMNFTLLYFLAIGKIGRMLGDVEWRAYLGIIGAATVLVIAFGLWHGDFAGPGDALRFGLFQVVSIMTTTGYGTADFDRWNSFGRAILFVLMFVGGCAGSTGGGLKVIRLVLFSKIIRLEVERAYHPRVIRPLRLGGRPIDDPELRKNILVYFGLILVIFVLSWLFVVAVEPDVTWGPDASHQEHKLLDSASGVAATLNNIGPGLGTVGATQNYTNFSPASKLLFVWLMMIGRLEIFAILVLFLPRFWRVR